MGLAHNPEGACTEGAGLGIAKWSLDFVQWGNCTVGRTQQAEVCPKRFGQDCTVGSWASPNGRGQGWVRSTQWGLYSTQEFVPNDLGLHRGACPQMGGQGVCTDGSGFWMGGQRPIDTISHKAGKKGAGGQWAPPTGLRHLVNGYWDSKFERSFGACSVGIANCADPPISQLMGGQCPPTTFGRCVRCVCCVQ